MSNSSWTKNLSSPPVVDIFRAILYDIVGLFLPGVRIVNGAKTWWRDQKLRKPHGMFFVFLVAVATKENRR